MTASEKVAYLKGLIEGMEIDVEKGEGKLLAAIIDVLEDLALGLDDVEDSIDELESGLDAVSDDLEEVEQIVYDIDEDEDDEDEDDDMEYDGEDDYDYSVVCPACGEEFLLENEDLDAGVITCPECGETLELDFSEDEDEEETEE
ncbi:MAG: hypothetical protein IJ788_00595 [Oscillospiraceae bacterium]|nr:hypothetical protein [Oscillospiraceae bacterium]